MNKEFFDALDVIEKERNIKKEVLLEKITKAMEVKRPWYRGKCES